ncbi:MAG: TetR/AcrR family transcriptional regulator [SAR324 cluster bacterium]|nr:TetR/AcrR family transcriptional regulator [SAR324 cluster bacterium]MBL7035462.1 TetR/AcrR family transcriptional regulator [SAR324 cluster bacterium]
MKKRTASRAKKTSFNKGQSRIKTILEAARDVFVDKGYNKLTMRKVALQAGITVGNLNYYYQTKEALFHDMLDQVWESYQCEFDKVLETSSKTPEERLSSLIAYLIQDLNTPETTKFFPELWALSNHDPYAQKMMEQIYSAERQVIIDLIAEVKPELDENTKNELALYFSCTIEGMTMFVGSGKSHESSLKMMQQMACESFLNLLHTR